MGEKKSKRVYVVLDFGASRVKGFMSYWNEVSESRRYESRLMVSEVIECGLTEYSDEDLKTDETCFVSHEDGVFWKVGEAARTSCDEVDACDSKASDALIKSLGVLGYLRESLDGMPQADGAEWVIALMLPVGEMDTKGVLVSALEEALRKFEFNGRELSLRVYSCRVWPEGSGLAAYVTSLPGVILMIGYRDVSVLPVSEKQTINQSESFTIRGGGMIRLLSQTPYQFNDQLRAAAVVVAAGDDLKLEALAKIAKAGEAELLQKALQESIPLYVRNLLRRLEQSSVYKTAQKVLCAGGTAYYLRNHLKKSLGSRYSIGKDALQATQDSFSDFKRNALVFRCADAFSLLMAIETDD